MFKFTINPVYLLIFICSSLLWQGCNPPAQTATYIHIDSFKFVPNPAVPGNITLSHQISCVWVYYNNNPVGVFDLPATFPVIATGNGTLGLFPGVIIDGQNNLTGQYPFYQPDTFTFAAQPGKTITHLPVTQYYSNIKVYNISNFESYSVNGTTTGFIRDLGTISMTRVTDPSLVFEGLGSGSINFTSPGDSSIDSTTTAFPIPTGLAFIEFNYKNTIPFYLGLQANLLNVVSSAPYYLTGIYPSNTWQKFHLSVADFAAQYQGNTYNFYIKAALDTGTSGRVLLDNIQLITF